MRNNVQRTALFAVVLIGWRLPITPFQTPLIQTPLKNRTAYRQCGQAPLSQRQQFAILRNRCVASGIFSAVFLEDKELVMSIDPLPLDGERADTRRKRAILFEILAIAIVGIILDIQTRKHRSSFVVLPKNSYPTGITASGLIHDLLPLSIHILTGNFPIA